ncbi:MAG: tRNA lysidine(34) synthetase TilS [Lautropia sp.]|nr:tRNA lysidine(34) synthetase TilS [Lautropia sp.]
MPIEALQQCLSGAGLGRDDTLLIACSGGRDSQVLLHAVAAVRPTLRVAVAHVHHGLLRVADGWLDFCAAEASALGLPFLFRRLTPPLMPGRVPGGVEAWAREWRYRALADMAAEVGARTVLTAHHANDQLETVELRRRRGSGVLGLAGMRERAPLPHAPAGLMLLRPFLKLSRTELADWARQRGLRWVEDPSNEDMRFARNRVRRQLEERLGRGDQSLPTELAAIGLFQQAADRLQQQAADDLAACRLHVLAPLQAAGAGEPLDAFGAWSDRAVSGLPGPGDRSVTAREGAVWALADRPGRGGEYRQTPVLSRSALLRLPAERRAEALRFWLGMLGCRMPSQAKLAELERQLVLAGASQACVRHDGVGLLRYRDRLGLMPAVQPVRPLYFRWQGETLLDLPAGRLYFDWLDGGVCVVDAVRGADEVAFPPSDAPDSSGPSSAEELSAPFDSSGFGSLAVSGARSAVPSAASSRFACWGVDAEWLHGQTLLLDQGRSRDRLRSGVGARSRSWKNRMQEQGVPPCLRSSLPVLRLGDELLFAAPFGMTLPSAEKRVQTRHRGPRLCFRWVPKEDIQSWL